MAVTVNSRGFVMTAAADAVTGKIKLASISLVGTGMSIGDRVTLTETSGAVISDHYIESDIENVELINEEQWVDGVILSAAPGSGTWNVYMRYL